MKIINLCCIVILSAMFFGCAAPFYGSSKNTPDTFIRVAIIQNEDSITLKNAGDKIELSYGSQKKSMLSCSILKAANGKVYLSDTPLGTSVYIRKPANSNRATLNGKNFAGEIKISAKGSKLTAIETLPMEQYLLGVVGSEMPPSWALEALKSQAVIARSFAYSKKNSSKEYDITATTADQVYKYPAVLNENVKKAVQQTAGMILTYNKKIIMTYFHSYCGGTTENPANVWENFKKGRIEVPAPYKKTVKDLYCKKTAPENLKSWSFGISSDSALNLAKKTNPAASKVKKIKIGKKTKSGRALYLTAYTDAGQTNIDLASLRAIIGAAKIKSTFITSVQKTKGGWTISGKGNGHGIGLCQYGAKGMADSGKNYKQILKYYYPGTKIEKY